MRPRRGAAALALALALAGAGCGQETPPAPAADQAGRAEAPATDPRRPAEAPAPAPSTTAAAPGPGTSAAMSALHPDGDATRGRQVYLAECVACHHRDPARPGPIGPPVRGASPELLAAKIVRGAYPEGYTPQRDSRVMPPRPDLAGTISDLAAYLR